MLFFFFHFCFDLPQEWFFLRRVFFCFFFSRFFKSGAFFGPFFVLGDRRVVMKGILSFLFFRFFFKVLYFFFHFCFDLPQEWFFLRRVFFCFLSRFFKSGAFFVPFFGSGRSLGRYERNSFIFIFSLFLKCFFVVAGLHNPRFLLCSLCVVLFLCGFLLFFWSFLGLFCSRCWVSCCSFFCRALSGGFLLGFLLFCGLFRSFFALGAGRRAALFSDGLWWFFAWVSFFFWSFLGLFCSRCWVSCCSFFCRALSGGFCLGFFCFVVFFGPFLLSVLGVVLLFFLSGSFGWFFAWVSFLFLVFFGPFLLSVLGVVGVVPL